MTTEHKNQVTLALIVSGERIGYSDDETKHEIRRWQVQLATGGRSRNAARQALHSIRSDWTNWQIHRSRGSNSYEIAGRGQVELSVELGGDVTDIHCSKTFAVEVNTTGHLVNALDAAVDTAYNEAREWLQPQRTGEPIQPMGLFESIWYELAGRPKRGRSRRAAGSAPAR